MQETTTLWSYIYHFNPKWLVYWSRFCPTLAASVCIRFKIRGGSPWDLKNIPSPGPCFLSALRVVKRENPRPLELTRRNQITNLRERLTLLQWLPHAWFLSSFSGDSSYSSSIKMHDINGYVYGNQPGLNMCVGDRVSWHIMSGILMHTPLFYGNTVTYNGKRTDAVGQIQGEENVEKKDKHAGLVH